MDPFDDRYLARREKQIQDLYMMRAVSIALGGLGGLGLIIVFFMRDWPFAPVVFLFSLVFLLAAFLMVVISTAQRAADKAIQKEHERLIALYSQAGIKRKREAQDTPMRLADDGEIASEALDEEQRRTERRAG
ncbi:MAG: hypothetical protein IT323_05815 [Anaerolineae bacterium]|nr:hypothetical protein [Anaerolineae bacterium]